MRARALITVLVGIVGSAALGWATAQGLAPAGPRPDGPPPPTPYDRDAVRYTPVTLYGLFNAGLARTDPSPQGSPCDATPAVPRVGIESVERSRLGLRTSEVLTGTLQAHLHLEQSLQLDQGEPLLLCQNFDARATVGLSHRDWGRVDLGRIEQPASALAQRADPWRGRGAGSPGWRGYLAPAAVGIRSPDSVQFASPEDLPLRMALQLRVSTAAAGRQHEHGGSLAWDRLPWLVGVGGHFWPDGSRAVPVVVAHDSGTLRLSAAFTRGRLASVEYRNVFVGASGFIMEKGDPQRHEWRVGFDEHRVQGGVAAWPSEHKWGAGWRYRLTRRTWVTMGVGWIKPQQQAARSAFDISLSHSFERNLRLPQWPW